MKKFFLGSKTNMTFNLCSLGGKMFCSSPFKYQSPVPTPIIATLCFAASQYPNQQKPLLVTQEQVSRQPASCFDKLPVLRYQDLRVTSNQVHWKNKWRRREGTWLVASLQEFKLIHPVCLVPVSPWSMILPWNIFVQASGHRHFSARKQAQVEPVDLKGRET